MELAEYAQADDNNGAHCTESGHEYQHRVTPNLSFGQVTISVSD
jgi:hypothetical protein